MGQLILPIDNVYAHIAEIVSSMVEISLASHTYFL